MTGTAKVPVRAGGREDCLTKLNQVTCQSLEGNREYSQRSGNCSVDAVFFRQSASKEK